MAGEVPGDSGLCRTDLQLALVIAPRRRTVSATLSDAFLEKTRCVSKRERQRQGPLEERFNLWRRASVDVDQVDRVTRLRVDASERLLRSAESLAQDDDGGDGHGEYHSELPVAQTNLQLYEQIAARPDAERLRVRAAYELATELFAGRYRGSGKPFVAHLVGTASVLAQHGAPLDVVLAGLLHAAYHQGEFGSGRPGMTVSRRTRMRRALGAGAEELIARYTRYEWSRVPDRIAPDDRPVVLMRIANEVDECADRGLLYSGSGKRRSMAEHVARFTVAAKALGEAQLAEQLQAAFASNHGALPDELRGSLNGSYTITCRSAPRFSADCAPYVARGGVERPHTGENVD